MTPLIILIVASLVFRSIGTLGVHIFQNWPSAVRTGLATMFLFTSSSHFNSLRTDLINMVPPMIPYPGIVVTITGVCEIIGGIGLIIPRITRFSAISLIVFLLLVLPANIYAALSGATINGSPVTPLWPRIIFQIVFIVAIWWSSIRRPLK